MDIVELMKKCGAACFCIVGASYIVMVLAVMFHTMWKNAPHWFFWIFTSLCAGMLIGVVGCAIESWRRR